jgi:hypothetical protein
MGQYHDTVDDANDEGLVMQPAYPTIQFLDSTGVGQK